MPRRVDRDERRHQIVAAALTIARDHGVRAITFRSIATEMGTSTSAITHYVDSRGDLFRLLFEHVSGAWRAEADERLATLAPEQGLRLVLPRHLVLDEERRLAERIWFGALVEAELRRELADWVQGYDEWYIDRLEAALSGCDLNVPTNVASDMLHSLTTGITAEALLSPSDWPASRQRETLEGLLSLLGVPSQPRPGA